MEWYYILNNEQHGPVDDAEIARLAQSGVIGPSDLVWNPTIGNQWVQASTIQGLFGAQLAAGVSQLTYQPSWCPPTGGQTPNRDLMSQAREALSGNWGIAVAAVVIVGAINIVLNLVQLIPILGILALIAAILITPSLMVGQSAFFLAISRKRPADIPVIFRGFDRFGTALAAYLLMILFVLLWMLLLIIPGIIASLSYAMTFWIIAEDPSVGAREAISRSKAMMQGRRWKFFCLGLRFLGWALLCVLTCGIGFLFLAPYMMTSTGRFYDDLRPAPAAESPAAEVSPSATDAAGQPST